MAKGKEPGAQLGSALLRAIVDGVVSARSGILPAEMAERSKAFTAQLEMMESELAPIIGEVVAPYLELDNLPPGLRGMLEEMAAPGHQVGFLLQFIGSIGFLMVAIPSLGQVTVRQAVYDLNTDTRNVPLSPTAAASAVARGFMTEETGDAQAAKSGLSPEAWQWLLAIAGEPPGIMDMVALYRRGAIPETRLRQAIRYSRIANTYIPTVELMAHQTMSPADAVEMAVKGITDPETAAGYFERGGGLPTEWQLLFEAAGDAIGVEKAITLWNHGILNETQVIAVIARSRINPIFYDIALTQRHKFLGNYQIYQAMTKGTVDSATAYEWLIGNGLTPAQADAFSRAGTTGTAQKAKSITEAMVTQMYVDRLLTATEAEAMLVNIGYDAQAANMLVELADAKRALDQQTTAITAVRSAFLAGHITATDASQDLDALNIPPDARTQWLATWTVEKSAKLKVLTAAQVGDMFKKGLMSTTEALARWQGMGYSGPDAGLLLGYYGGPPPPTSPAAQTKTTAA